MDDGPRVMRCLDKFTPIRPMDTKQDISAPLTRIEDAIFRQQPRQTRVWPVAAALVLLGLVFLRGLPAGHRLSDPHFRQYTDAELTSMLRFRPIEELYPAKYASANATTQGIYPGKRNVAIVGAGAFGSSLAYFLHQLVPPTDLAITVFEKLNRPGGRVRAMGTYDPCKKGPVAFELGASIFVEGNEFLMNLTKKMGLDLKNDTDYPMNPPGTRQIGLWDGTKFLYSFSGGFWTGPAAFLRWGFSILNGKNLAADTQNKWDEVYDKLQAGEYFSSPGSLLRKLDGLDTLVTGTSAREYLSSVGLGDRYLDEFVEPTTLVNYFQNLSSINSLAALVSMTAAYTPTHQIRGGNFQLFEELLVSSEAGWVKGSSIVEVKREPGPGKAKYTLVDGDGKHWDGFDEVVLAGPLQSLNISLPTDSSTPFFPREYVTVYVTIVTGILNGTYFGLPPDAQAPLDIVVPRSPETPVPFRSISVIHRYPCLALENNITVTKIFSETAPSTADLLKIYAKVYELERFSWPAAYPYLDPYKSPEEMPGYGPYGDGIWFGGGFEAAFSCMEGEVVSARNLAGLMAETMVKK